MLGISKGMVAAAAVIAFGLVTAEDMAKGFAKPVPASTHSENSVSDSVVRDQGVLRERAAAVLRELMEKQRAAASGAAKPVEVPKCIEQSRPYYTGECLVRQRGAEPRTIIRVVSIDRRGDGAVFAAKLR